MFDELIKFIDYANKYNIMRFCSNGDGRFVRVKKYEDVNKNYNN